MQKPLSEHPASSASHTQKSPSDLQPAPAPEIPLDSAALLGDAGYMVAEIPIERRRPRHEGEAQAVVDHGEAAGAQCEAPAEGTGDHLAARSRRVGHRGLGRQPGADIIEFSALQPGEQVALRDDVRPLAAGEPVRREMLGTCFDGIAYLLSEPASSQIEGTQSSLSDLLLFENDEEPSVPLDDVTEVSNYVAAIEHGVARMRGGFPLSLRLIREMHDILLKSGRGATKQPGEFRRSQNWIGGTRPGNALFVPPPPDRLDESLDALERFFHGEDPALPPLIRAGLAHVQFETIHPFLDGNGRLGRLLITLVLCEAGLLREPILYLSLFLKSRRDDYYRLLQEVRQAGTWETWMEFFLTGVAETAEQAVATARALLAMFDADRQKVAGIGRAAASALRVHELMQAQPIITIQTLSKKLGISFATAGASLENLTKIGVMREATGRRRGRLYIYTDYLKLLDRGTDPLPA